MKKWVLVILMCMCVWGNDSSLSDDSMQMRTSANESNALYTICQGIEMHGCVAVFEENCNNGDYHACGILAQVYRLVGDYENAIRYGSIACVKIDHNSPATTTTINGDEITISKALARQSKIAECHNIGNTFIEGKHFKVDFSKAIAPFMKACELGYMKSCHNAAMIYSNGGNGVKKDMKLAKGLFAHLCLETADIGYCSEAKAIKCFFWWCFRDTFNLFN